MADKTAFDYVNEIWSIANYVRDVIRPADYNKLILPFAVLRRFECALEPTRAAVSRQAAKGVWDDDDPKYCALSGHCFYNVTSFTLSNLGATKTCDALMAYINGFSVNAREVLQRFEMRQTCEKLDEKGMLYEVCTRFSGFDLGPETVSDRMMTDIYEHLIQRYGEEISQDAEDFMTPKDVARLATALLFANEDTLLNADNGDIRTLYDGSCGTCGFICDALDQLDEWHDKGHFKSPTKIVPYGQELEDATWAMGKAALMLRNIAGGSGDVLDQMTDLSAGIMLGDTLDDDRFEGRTFNYQLTNPPYGKEWKKEKDAVLEEMGRGFDGRFGAGKPDIDDGSMLFMQNVAAKMAPPKEGGGKAAIVLSGSPLFNGDAGSGPSGIRRWLFSEDLVDCIVKLPTEIFYRTGIATYIWVLNNHKPENRKGYVQLIDASEEKTALRKSQGNKRYEIGEDQAAWIVRTYVDGHDHGRSVIVPVENFMYRKVTTQRRCALSLSPRSMGWMPSLPSASPWRSCRTRAAPPFAPGLRRTRAPRSHTARSWLRPRSFTKRSKSPSHRRPPSPTPSSRSSDVETRPRLPQSMRRAIRCSTPSSRTRRTFQSAWKSTTTWRPRCCPTLPTPWWTSP